MQKKIAVFIYRFDKETRTPVFLLLHRSEKFAGYWQPITGRVEGDESLTDAARREISEETGLREVTLHSEPCFVFEFEKHGKRIQEFIFSAQTDETDVKLSIEHSEFAWLPFEQALENLFWENNKEALRRLYQHLLASHQL